MGFVSLLPMFMVTTLGASALEVGWIEGIAESTVLIIKVFSGAPPPGESDAPLSRQHPHGNAWICPHLLLQEFQKDPDPGRLRSP